MTGTSIGHFEILERVGEGGMGVVYKARDSHLDRIVAIKILRPEAVRDPERKRRFVQEAKLASALNHPNIVTIYDIATCGDTDYIAMEYVPGRTLDALIGRRGLGMNEALKYGAQIASALARAHKAGIIHRDLKPGNVIVGEGGVKVLDFGLAKLVAEDAGPETDLTRTLRAPAQTEEGAIVGTAAYMSPEQASGQEVDARSDIFSFGSMLYEMLTGARPFAGENKISTLSAILHGDPKPVAELAPELPPELVRLIERCLRKDPERRIQNMADVKVTLEDLREESESGKLMAAPARAKPARRSFGLAALVLAVAAIAVAAVVWLSSRTAALPPEPVVRRLTADLGLTADPALSPDGRMVAFASDRSGEGNLDIWVMHISSGAPVRLTSDHADDSQPCFAPDGSRIAFRSAREPAGIYVVPTFGGEPRLIAPGGFRPMFSPDGKSILYWDNATGYYLAARSYVVPVSGGAPRQVRPDFARVGNPVWSPDGAHILFEGARTLDANFEKEYDWWVTPVEGGDPIRTGAYRRFVQARMANPQPAVWLPGRVIYSGYLPSEVANLMEIPISARTFQAGQPRRLIGGTTLDTAPSAAGDLIAYASLTTNNDLWSIPIDSRGRVSGEMQRLTNDAARDAYPCLSHDGRILVFQSTRSRNAEIWRRDMDTGREMALTSTSEPEFWPVIQPGGERVAFSNHYGSPREIRTVPAAGGVVERLCADCGRPTSWTSDGKYLLFHRGDSLQITAVALLDVASGETTVVAARKGHDLSAPRFAPDDKWVLFYERVSPQARRVWIVPFRGKAEIPTSEWIAVTDGRGLDREPRWSWDGNRVFFASTRDGFPCIWSQALDPVSKQPRDPAEPVYHFHRARLSQEAPDALGLAVGKDKLVVSLDERNGNIWLADFGRRRD